MPPRRVHIIDTATGSGNIGDQIIMEACREVFDPLFESAYVSSSSGHDGLGPSSRSQCRESDVVMLMGTNALSPYFRVGLPFMWRVSWRDLRALKGKVVLAGVGATWDFRWVNPLQKRFWRYVLSADHAHSVRDELGAKLVQACGHRVLNTSCPTLWQHRNVHPLAPTTTSRAVCFTLNKHKGSPIDEDFVRILADHYDQLYYWPQTTNDIEYLASLRTSVKAQSLAPNLAAYDAFLRTHDVDVVGTRLHGSIRGLNHGRRTLVVSIDNRARELGQATGLPVIERGDVRASLASRLRSEIHADIHMDDDAIGTFLGQFR